MEIKPEVLRSLLRDAYLLGCTRPADLADQCVTEVAAKAGLSLAAEMRVFPVAELRSMPEGAILNHLIHGRCRIRKRGNGSTYAQFERSGSIYECLTNADPWDKPMRVVFKP